MADENIFMNDSQVQDQQGNAPQVQDDVPQPQEIHSNPYDQMKSAGGPAMTYNSGQPAGAGADPYSSAQSQSPYAQGNPYNNMQAQSPYAQSNPYNNMQAQSPYAQGNQAAGAGADPYSNAQAQGARPNPYNNMQAQNPVAQGNQAAGAGADPYSNAQTQGARPNPYSNMQAQNPYMQGNPYNNMQAQNPYMQGNPYAGAQGGFIGGQNGGVNQAQSGQINPYFQGTPNTPEGGKPAKKKMPKGKKIGIISGVVALVAALVVCGIIFIPKLFKPKKETIQKAFKSTQTSFIEGNTIAKDLGLTETGESFKNKGGRLVFNIKNPENSSEYYEADISIDSSNKEASFELSGSDRGQSATLRGYANKEKAYITIDDLLNGYYYVDFATAMSDFANSYILTAGTSSYYANSNIYDLLSTSGVPFSPAQIEKLEEVFKKLRDSVDYSKDGTKKLTLGGHSYDATKYVVTIPKEDIQNAVTDAMDIVMSTAASSLGGNAEYYTTMISSYISTIFSKDIKINVYICDGNVIAMDAGYEIDVIGNKAGISFDMQFEGPDDLFSALDGSIKLTVEDHVMEYHFDYDSYETSTGSETTMGIKLIEDGDIDRQLDFITNYNEQTSDIVVSIKTSDWGDEEYYNLYGKVISLEKGKKLEIQFDTAEEKFVYEGETDGDSDLRDVDLFIGLYADYNVEKVPSDATLVNLFTSSESELKSIMNQKMIDLFDKAKEDPYEIEDWDD